VTLSREQSPFERRQTAVKNAHGKRAEAKTAARLGLRQTINSGAGSDKGDLKDRQHRGENKSTTADSFSVKLEHLEKISREAAAANAVPFLAFQFVLPNTGQAKTYGRWLAIPEWYFHQLTKR